MNIEWQVDVAGFEVNFQRDQDGCLIHLIPWRPPSFQDLCRWLHRILAKRESFSGTLIQLLGIDGQIMVTGVGLQHIHSEAELTAFVGRLIYAIRD